MSNYIGYIVLGVYVVFCVIFIYITIKSMNSNQNKFSNALRELEEHGIKFNHSYKIINKEDNSIVRYFRLYGMKIVDNVVCGQVLYVTKDTEEIGTWCDDYKYLFAINEKNQMIDCGKWGA